MRTVPISTEIEQAVTLKHVYSLCIELKNLLLSKLQIDRRTIPKGSELQKYKGTLNLYCKLYNRAYDRFFELRKTCIEEKDYVKTPIEFDILVREYNWSKIAGTKTPIRKKNFFQTDLNIDEMSTKSFFYRNDPEVVADASSMTEEEFIGKYITLTTEEVLKNVYKEIGSKKTTTPLDKKVGNRIGKESSEEPLVTLPTTGEPLKGEPLVGKVVDFVFSDGGLRTGTVIEVKGDRIVIQGVGPKGNKYTVTSDKIVPKGFELESEGGTITETKTTVKEVKVKPTKVTPTTPPSISDSETILFKSLPIEERKRMISNHLEQGITSCSKIIKSLKEQGYTMIYDDVYFPLEAIKKGK